MEQHHIAGVAVAVVQDGRVVIKKGIGSRCSHQRGRLTQTLRSSASGPHGGTLCAPASGR
ncbi:MAG: hypothetical protein C5B57_08740 [Blastocatellia bacterium]|nr:MAG: hypothetical protein C5B57_08740 [Blastocatellia bacterium]